jgi:5-formyltetrahydrofolate cyclo-ligase
MLKKDIRKYFLNQRSSISAHEKMKWDDLLLIQFQTLALPFLEYVLSFYPIEQNNEVDTFLITDYLHFKNPAMHLCYPRIDANKISMDAVICSADSIFVANTYNIPEPVDTEIAKPAQIDLVIIPMVACDLQGNRVGYGKGFYDRYLKLCREDCLCIGFSYFEPLDVIDDASEFDVPLDFCITPQRTYVF